MPAEAWLPVRGFEGVYDVSSIGRVRCWLLFSRRLAAGPLARPRIVRPTDRLGYLSVQLRGLCGQTVMRYVHRLVLEAFLGPCPDGHEGCHFPDQSGAYARLDSLRWDSHRENSIDMAVHRSRDLTRIAARLETLRERFGHLRPSLDGLRLRFVRGVAA